MVTDALAPPAPAPPSPVSASALTLVGTCAQTCNASVRSPQCPQCPASARLSLFRTDVCQCRLLRFLTLTYTHTRARHTLTHSYKHIRARPLARGGGVQIEVDRGGGDWQERGGGRASQPHLWCEQKKKNTCNSTGTPAAGANGGLGIALWTAPCYLLPPVPVSSLRNCV
jgi:hypothetical protein